MGRGHSNKCRGVASLHSAERCTEPQEEIAAALLVSLRTAEARVTNVLNKLGLRSRAQLTVWAAEHGLLNVTAED